MIKEWRFGNFKSVKEPQKISLSSLNVFTGANSSGKSTLLQSILLLKQSLNNKIRQRQVVLNGEEVRLGTFEDVLPSGSTMHEIHIGFTLDVGSEYPIVNRSNINDFSYVSPLHDPDIAANSELEVNLLFRSENATDDQFQSKHQKLQAELLSSEYRMHSKPLNNLEAAFGIDQPIQEIKIARRTQEEIESIYSQLDIPKIIRGNKVDPSILSYSVTGIDKHMRYSSYRHFRSNEKLDIIGIQLDHFLPGRIINRYRILQRRISRLMENISVERGNRKKIEDFLLSDDGIQNIVVEKLLEIQRKLNLGDYEFLVELRAAILSRRPRKDAILEAESITREIIESFPKSQIERKSIEAQVPPPVISFINESITSTFNSILYLGPLRDEPRPIYDISGYVDPSDIGIRGENTASVLDLYSDKEIDYINPHISNGEPEKAKLKEAVRNWLSFFDIANRYETEEEGKLGHRLYVYSDFVDRRLDLTNVGVGVSQILPIIVMSLLADAGSILIFEQPELHLHPKVQSLLGDFFISLISTGKQCIVETHSEYLINRLRLRVAESNWESDLKDKIKLYFVERIEGNTKFNKVIINEYGAIPSWPKGFFDQGPLESDRIMMAARNKDKTKNKKTI